MREFNTDRFAWFCNTMAGVARGVNEVKVRHGDTHAARSKLLKEAGIPEDPCIGTFRETCVLVERRGNFFSAAEVAEIFGALVKGYDMYEALRPKN